MIEIHRKKKHINDLNLIPLINVVFVLLIFFMVVGRLERTDLLGVELPRTHHVGSRNAQSDPVMVYVNKTGRIAVNNDFVAKDDLLVIVKTALLEQPMRSVRVKADAKLLASELIWVIATIQESGAQSVSIMTRREL